jgi:hypothetical protein
MRRLPNPLLHRHKASRRNRLVGAAGDHDLRDEPPSGRRARARAPRRVGRLHRRRAAPRARPGGTPGPDLRSAPAWYARRDRPRTAPPGGRVLVAAIGAPVGEAAAPPPWHTGTLWRTRCIPAALALRIRTCGHSRRSSRRCGFGSRVRRCHRCMCTCHLAYGYFVER